MSTRPGESERARPTTTHFDFGKRLSGFDRRHSWQESRSFLR
jgi:hypothetical protein